MVTSDRCIRPVGPPSPQQNNTKSVVEVTVQQSNMSPWANIVILSFGVFPRFVHVMHRPSYTLATQIATMYILESVGPSIFPSVRIMNSQTVGHSIF